MIKKSVLFFVYVGLIFEVLALSHVSASEPMSAIDWLAEKINAPPDFYTLSNEKLEDFEKVDNGIKINQLPGISKNSIGIFGGTRLGLPFSIWSNESETLIASKVEKIPVSRLFHLNRFLKRILLVEADPPITDQDSKYSGRDFLRARLLKLITMGALDDAEALIETSQPTSDPALVDIWTDIAFLTRRLDGFCDMVLQSHNVQVLPSHRIICLARSGDWNAAALALATYSSIGEINDTLEPLLINYLDHEAELKVERKKSCELRTPALLYLCEISGIRTPDHKLSVKFLYSNLGRTNSLRKRIAASERFVQSGAMDPNILFSTYKIKQPSASGGIWERARIIQELDKNFNIQELNQTILLQSLSLAVGEFTNRNLLTQFTEVYGQKIREHFKTGTTSTRFNEMLVGLILLSGENLDGWALDSIKSSKINSAIYLATEKIGWILDEGKRNETLIAYLNSRKEDQLTLLEKVVLEASVGKFPDGRRSADDIKVALSEQRIGLVLLEALSHISYGESADLLELQVGLTSLVRLGLLEEFKFIATEILITDYFRNSVDYY